MGSAVRRAPFPSRHRSPSPTPGPALVDADNHIGDDWLIDDVREQHQHLGDVDNVFKNMGTQKRKRRPTETKTQSVQKRKRIPTRIDTDSEGGQSVTDIAERSVVNDRIPDIDLGTQISDSQESVGHDEVRTPVDSSLLDTPLPSSLPPLFTPDPVRSPSPPPNMSTTPSRSRLSLNRRHSQTTLTNFYPGSGPRQTQPQQRAAPSQSRVAMDTWHGPTLTQGTVMATQSRMRVRVVINEKAILVPITERLYFFTIYTIVIAFCTTVIFTIIKTSKSSQ